MRPQGNGADTTRNVPSSPVVPRVGSLQAGPSPSRAVAADETPTLAATLRHIVSLAGPMTLTLLCRFAQGFIDLAVVGHALGTRALAGASLALTIQFVTMGFVTMGFGDAVPTLCSQALGAGNKTLVGVWLQLGAITCTAACVPVMAVWWFTGPILRAAGVDDATAADAATFGQWSIFRMWPQCMYYCVKMYLSSQERVRPDLVVNLVCVPITLALDVLLVQGGFGWGGWGLKGAAVANTIARFLVFGGVWAYGYAAGYYTDTWGGWAVAEACSGKRLRAFMRLALPAMARSVVDLGQVQTVALFAAALGTVPVSTHNTLIQLYAVFGGSWAFSLTDATAVLVGQALGKGLPAAAQRVARVSTTLSLCVGVVVGVVLLLVRSHLGRLFSDDTAVIQQAADVTPWMSLLIVMTAGCFSTLGTILGQGRMACVPVIWMVGTLLIIPMGYVLAFTVHQHLRGLWEGWVAGYFVIASWLSIMVCTSRWQPLAAAAAMRSEKRSSSAVTPSAAACKLLAEEQPPLDATAVPLLSDYCDA